MESLFGCKFFVVLLGLISFVLAEDETILELFVKPEEVRAKDNVVLRCEVTNLVMGQFIRWSKIVQQDNMPVTYNVATNGQMEGGFNQPNSRYSADYDIIDAKKVAFILSIKNVRNEDGGNYRCSMGDTVSENDLLVFEPPSSISMTLTINGTDRIIQDGEEIKFEDGTYVSVRCEVGGSNPEPEVEIKMGEWALPDVKVFPSNVMTVVQGDARGQVRSTWDVTAKATDIIISHGDAANSLLSCQAKVKDDMSIKTGFTIKMEGRPPVFQCDAIEQMARLYETGVILQCTAKATPPVTTGNVYYMENGKSKVTIEPENYNEHFGLYLETEEATGETTMRFTIAKVTPEMFRNYTFYVYNDVGKTEHTILLYKDPTQKQVADDPSNGSSSLSLLACVLVTLTSWLTLALL